MKANMMRAPLIKSAVVLLVFTLLAYLTSASPDGSVLNSVGLIIIGAFRFVQWAIAMIIGVSFCIAFLIGVFLFAVFLVDRDLSASLYEKTKVSVAALVAPVFSLVGVMLCKDASCAQPVQAVMDNDQLKNELQTIITGEVKKVSDSQQVLHEQFVSLNAKIQSIEEKAAGFASADQLAVIAGEIAASGKTLETVESTVATLEGKLNDTTQKLQAITPEKLLGDLPSRLDKLEQKGDEPGFDPKPLSDSIESLHKEVEQLMKQKSPAGGSRSKKKA